MPLEQSFTATLETGEAPGNLELTLSVVIGSGETRTETRVVPILRR